MQGNETLWGYLSWAKAVKPCKHRLLIPSFPPSPTHQVDTVLEIVGEDIVLREGWISDILDLMVKTRAFQYFLSTGRLLPPTDLTLTGGRGGGREGGRVRDEEYLGGVMGLSQELSRHAIKRASALDVVAVARCGRREGGERGWVGLKEGGRSPHKLFFF